MVVDVEALCEETTRRTCRERALPFPCTYWIHEEHTPAYMLCVSGLPGLYCAVEQLRISRSFTQLVQDNQFSALGLALIAEIAKISKTISSFADPEEESEDNPATIRTAEGFSARGPTEDLGEAVGSPINLDSTVYDSAVPATNQLPSRPMQEGVTQRCPSGDADGTGNLDSIRDAQPAKVQSVARLSANEVNLISSGPSRKPKSNKKRQSNPIDDLFDGLG